MIICPVCGFRNMDANDRCFKCSALLKRDETLFKESARAVSKRTFADRNLRVFLAPLDWLRHRSWFSRIFDVPENRPFRYPFTAGLLSLVPGAGHLYAGQPAKAAIAFAIGAAMLTTALLNIRASWSNLLLFTMLAYWLLVWADSVASTAQANGDTWRWRKTLALMCGAMMLLGFSITVMQWFGVNVLTFQRVTTATMAPALRSGDRIVFSDLPIWFGKPRAGDVVMFDPPRFEAHQGSNIYSVNISKYFQRVLGEPGDRVAKRHHTFYRNGTVVPEELEPYAGANLPDFDLTVPPKCYFIPVTGIPSDVMAGLMGAGDLAFVGEPGYVFPKWPDFAVIEEDWIRAKGVAIINPPERRRWL